MKKLAPAGICLLLFLLNSPFTRLSGLALPSKHGTKLYRSDTLPIGNFTEVYDIDSTDSTVGPELSLQGYRQHWRLGIDVHNHGGGEDFVPLAMDIPGFGVRDLVYMNANKTGNNTITDSTSDPTIGFFLTPPDSTIQTTFTVPDTHPNRTIVGIRKSQYTTTSGSYMAFYTSAGLTTPVMSLNSSAEFTPYLKTLGDLSILSSSTSSTNYLDLNANPTDGSTDILLKDLYNSGSREYSFAVMNSGQTKNYLSINQSSGDVGINCTNPTSLLTVNGTLACVESVTTIFDCQNLKINKISNWSDYVFGKDFNLRPPGEIEKYIQKFKRLPGMPATEAVKQNGIDLLKMQKTLLRKIEELTLYALDREKKIRDLESLNEQRMALLEKEFSEIENSRK
jgi:hypothetical protein